MIEKTFEVPLLRYPIFIVIGGLLLATTACPQTLIAQGKKGGRERGPALVEATHVVKKLVSTSESFIGSLKPVRRSVIGSAVAGRVQDVLIEDGDSVGRDVSIESEEFIGQPLVEILRTSVDIEIEAAQIELELREKAYEELKQSLPKEIELAKATVEQALAQKEYAEQVFERAKELAENRGISQSELEQGISTYRTQLQVLIAAESDLQRLELTREIRLIIADKRIKAQHAEIRRLNDLRDKHTLRAPFPGFVTRKLVEIGDWVTPGSPVAEVIQLDPIELRINVPQVYLSELQDSFDGESSEHPFTATVTIDSLNQTFEGKVTRIVPQADEMTRSLPVVIRVQNLPTSNGYLLRPGLLANASLSIGDSQERLMVSKDALVLGQDQVDIFLLSNTESPRPTVRRVTVQTGVADGDLIEISGDVREGDQVVVQGNERLRDGEEVMMINRND